MRIRHDRLSSRGRRPVKQQKLEYAAADTLVQEESILSELLNGR